MGTSTPHASLHDGDREYFTLLTTGRNRPLPESNSCFDDNLPNYLFLCGNKMPTRCNRGFYCRSYCMLNMFRAPLCPSSGAQDYYTVVAVCGISCCGFQVAGLVWSCGLCVLFAGCCSNLKTTVRNTTRSNHCIILLSS